MSPAKRPQQYVAVLADPEDGQQNLSRRPRPRPYKPTVTRMPVLLSFALFLTVCVVLIEVIIHKSSRPSYMLPGQTKLKVRDIGLAEATGSEQDFHDGGFSNNTLPESYSESITAAISSVIDVSSGGLAASKSDANDVAFKVIVQRATTAAETVAATTKAATTQAQAATTKAATTQAQAATTPAKATTTAAPVTTTPVKVTTTQVQVTTTPVPVTTTQVKVTTTPVPVTTTPVPVTTTQIQITTTPVPVTTTQVQVATTPVPVTTTPVPVTTTPVPVVTTPVPVTTTPIPVTTTPPAITTTPVPITTTPPPVTTTPVPYTTTPPVATTTPDLTTTTPVPVVTTPTPVTTTPDLITTTPVPITTTPVPVTTIPIPVTTTPIPVTTTPIPVTTTPVQFTTTPIPTTTTPVQFTTTPLPFTTTPPAVSTTEAFTTSSTPQAQDFTTSPVISTSAAFQQTSSQDTSKAVTATDDAPTVTVTKTSDLLVLSSVSRASSDQNTPAPVSITQISTDSLLVLSSASRSTSPQQQQQEQSPPAASSPSTTAQPTPASTPSDSVPIGPSTSRANPGPPQSSSQQVASTVDSSSLLVLSPAPPSSAISVPSSLQQSITIPTSPSFVVSVSVSHPDSTPVAASSFAPSSPQIPTISSGNPAVPSSVSRSESSQGPIVTAPSSVSFTVTTTDLLVLSSASRSDSAQPSIGSGGPSVSSPIPASPTPSLLTAVSASRSDSVQPSVGSVGPSVSSPIPASATPSLLTALSASRSDAAQNSAVSIEPSSSQITLATSTQSLLLLSSVSRSDLAQQASSSAGLGVPSSTLPTVTQSLLPQSSTQSSGSAQPIQSSASSALPTISIGFSSVSSSTSSSSGQPVVIVGGSASSIPSASSSLVTTAEATTTGLLVLSSGSRTDSVNTLTTGSLLLLSSTSIQSSSTVPGAIFASTPGITSGLISPSQSVVSSAGSAADQQSHSNTDSQNVYTTTTQYTSLIQTTDAAGHSTNYSAVVVQQTVFTSSPVSTPTPQNEGVTDSQTLYTVSTTFTSVIATTDARGHSTTYSAVIVEQTVMTNRPGPTSSATTSATTTGAQPSITPLTKSEMVVSTGSLHFNYFAGVYLAPIFAVIIKTFWEIIFAAFKMMGPFQRLSEPNGALAERTLFAQYLSNSISYDTIQACFSGKLLPLFTTIVYALVTVLAAVATSSMSARATYMCTDTSGTLRRCNPAWIINRPVLRAVEGILIACIFFCLLVAIFSWRYKTTVPWNPSSIASVAALFNHEPLIRDFRQVDPGSDEASMILALRNRNTRLEYHQDRLGKYYYGVTRDLTTMFPEVAREQPKGNVFTRWFSGYDALNNPLAVGGPQPRFWHLSHHTQSHILDGLQLLSILGMFAVFIGYQTDAKSDPFNNFFNSNTFQARFTFVAVATVVDIQWKRLEREVRITEPYRRMGKGRANPATTILMTLNGTCWSEFPRSVVYLFKHRHMWFQTLVSFIAICADFNIIAAASFVYSDAQTIQTLTVSSWLTISITCLMIIVMLITMLWWRRTRTIRNMPRIPDTVGAVMAYLCASRLTQTLGTESLEHFSQQERNELIVAADWRMWFGRKICLDGRERWSIDIDGTSQFQVKPKTRDEKGDVLYYG